MIHRLPFTCDQNREAAESQEAVQSLGEQAGYPSRQEELGNRVAEQQGTLEARESRLAA